MGLIFLGGGIAFIIMTFVTAWFFIFYGIALTIIGILLLLNKNEDKIEERQDLNKNKSKK
jgi:glucose dehydrogenase